MKAKISGTATNITIKFKLLVNITIFQKKLYSKICGSSIDTEVYYGQTNIINIGQ